MIQTHTIEDLVGGMEVGLESLQKRRRKYEQQRFHEGIDRIDARINEVERFLAALRGILEEVEIQEAQLKGENLSDLLTAKEAKLMFMRPHTIEEILTGVKLVAPHKHYIGGYNPQRMPGSLIRKLEDLGYVVERDDNGLMKVRWD